MKEKFIKLIGGSDKLIHALVCFAATLMIHDLGVEPLKSGIIVFIIGLLNEYVDDVKGNWDWVDVLANVVGIVLCLVFINIV